MSPAPLLTLVLATLPAIAWASNPGPLLVYLGTLFLAISVPLTVFVRFGTRSYFGAGPSWLVGFHSAVLVLALCVLLLGGRYALVAWNPAWIVYFVFVTLVLALAVPRDKKVRVAVTILVTTGLVALFALFETPHGP